MADDAYRASREIGRWVIPFAVTTICLLGFLAMRKWSVYVYALSIVLQALSLFAWAAPVSTTALVIQAVLWLFGAAHWGKMR